MWLLIAEGSSSDREVSRLIPDPGVNFKVKVTFSKTLNPLLLLLMLCNQGMSVRMINVPDKQVALPPVYESMCEWVKAKPVVQKQWSTMTRKELYKHDIYIYLNILNLYCDSSFFLISFETSPPKRGMTSARCTRTVFGQPSHPFMKMPVDLQCVIDTTSIAGGTLKMSTQRFVLKSQWKCSYYIHVSQRGCNNDTLDPNQTHYIYVTN